MVDIRNMVDVRDRVDIRELADIADMMNNGNQLDMVSINDNGGHDGHDGLDRQDGHVCIMAMIDICWAWLQS